MLVYTDVCTRARPTDDNPLRVETCSDYDYIYFIYYSIWGQQTIQVSDRVTIEKVGLQQRLKTTKHLLEKAMRAVRINVKIILK
jgi:hypothetical protein